MIFEEKIVHKEIYKKTQKNSLSGQLKISLWVIRIYLYMHAYSKADSASQFIAY